MAWRLLWLVFGAMVAGCSPPNRGVLAPIEDSNVELVSTHGQPNDTARLIIGGVTAEVTGLWSDQNESVEIRYQAWRTPSSIAVTSASTSTWNGRVAPATSAWDRSAPEPGNAIGRPLLEAGPLQFTAGASKLVQIEFARTNENDRPSIGDEVTITIPMPGGTRATRFRVAGE